MNGNGQTGSLQVANGNSVGTQAEEALQSPQREAAFFFGLFLRGHNADTLRRDIEFPPELLHKWLRYKGPEVPPAQELQRVFEYRKQVLAIFNFLVNSEAAGPM